MTARQTAVLRCLAVLCSCSHALADEQVEARAIVERAIEAAGGRAALARYKKPFLRVSEGTLPGRNGPTAFEIKVTVLLPEKLRTDQSNADGVKFSIVFDGKQGWTNSSGAPARPLPGPGGRVQQPKVGPREMNEDGIRLNRYGLYAQWLATLLPIVDEDRELKKAEDLTIDGRTAAGISVTRKDWPEVRLYFDKETSALVKLARKTIVNDQWSRSTTTTMPSWTA